MVVCELSQGFRGLGIVYRLRDAARLLRLPEKTASSVHPIHRLESPGFRAELCSTERDEQVRTSHS